MICNVLFLLYPNEFGCMVLLTRVDYSSNETLKLGGEETSTPDVIGAGETENFSALPALEVRLCILLFPYLIYFNH